MKVKYELRSDGNYLTNLVDIAKFHAVGVTVAVENVTGGNMTKEGIEFIFNETLKALKEENRIGKFVAEYDRIMATKGK